MREKELPKQLKDALMIQAGIAEIVDGKATADIEQVQNQPLICVDDQGGDVCDRRQWRKKGAIRSGSGQNFASVSEQKILGTATGNRIDVAVELTPTLRANMRGHQPLVPQPMLMASTQPNAEITVGISPTVTANSGEGGGNTPILFENHPLDCRYNGPLEVSPTLASVIGTGGNNGPIILNDNKQESFCIASNIINREDHNGGNGKGFQKNISYTITTSDIHAIYSPKPYQDVIGTLMHRDHKGVNTCYVNQDKCIVAPQNKKSETEIFGQASYGGYDEDVSTLTASGGTNEGGSENLAVTRNLVRRLTPLECERLQGFPDDWTNIAKASDSPRYKALGNSVAVPCVDFLLNGVAFVLKKSKSENQKHEQANQISSE